MPGRQEVCTGEKLSGLIAKTLANQIDMTTRPPPMKRCWTIGTQPLAGMESFVRMISSFQTLTLRLRWCHSVLSEVVCSHKTISHRCFHWIAKSICTLCFDQIVRYNMRSLIWRKKARPGPGLLSVYFFTQAHFDLKQSYISSKWFHGRGYSCIHGPWQSS